MMRMTAGMEVMNKTVQIKRAAKINSRAMEVSIIYYLEAHGSHLAVLLHLKPHGCIEKL